MQSLLRLAFPRQCINCDALVEQEFGLCSACWAQTPFIAGLVCDACGLPLHGADDGTAAHCDDCLKIARPWRKGRAALLYKDNGRKLVLALKHGDRIDLAKPAAGWLLQAARPLLEGSPIIVPVPVHRWRLLKRRYNQAALLTAELARLSGLKYVPDALVRIRQTEVQDGQGVEARFANLSGAIQPRRTAQKHLTGRDVLLVDDVMTSGATLAAATEASYAAGAKQVDIVTIARVAKDD